MKRIKEIYNSKWFDVILFAVYMLILFIVYHNLYAKKMLPISGDGLGFFAMRFFTIDAAFDGELPLWNPTLENGIPWAADFYGIFYPIQWLLGSFSTLNFVYFFYIIHIAMGAFFTYKFLREVKIQKGVSISVGLIYMLSTHIGGLRKSHMILIVGIVYLPVVLYFLEKFINNLKVKYLMIAAIAMAIAFYSGGHVQILFYMDMILGIYLVCMLIYKKISLLKIISYGALWVLVYLGLIALQLIPAAEMLMYYAKSGAAETSYEVFNSYSIHPIKLLMMLFPEIFNGELYLPMGMNYSSEMDIDIFLGVSVVGIILLCISKVIKDYQTKVYLGIAIGSFLFAAQAHIPIVSEMIYKIPLISSFRVPSRILFVFIFFVLCIFAKALNVMITEISNGDRTEIQRYMKRCWLAAIISVAFCLMICFQLILIQYDGTAKEIDTLNVIFGKCRNFIGVVVCGGLVFGVLQKLLQKEKRYINFALVLFLLMTTVLPIMETKKYSTFTQGIDVESLESGNEYLAKLSEDIGTGKLLVASPYIDGTYASPISFSRNVLEGIPTINAYVSINNPNLFNLMSYNTALSPSYNYSGLYTGFQDIYNNLLLDNDIISMLGVKYIIDQENLILPSGSIVSEMKDAEQIYKNSDTVVVPDCDGQIYVVQSEPLNIKSNTYYKVRLTITSSEEQKGYIDFFGGSEYDRSAQESHMAISEGTNEYEVVINSGKCPNVETIVCRLVCTPDSEMTVKDMTVSEQEVTWQDGVYEPINVGEIPTYVNTNAQEVIFAVDSVVGVEDEEEIYQNRRQYNFVQNSYVEGVQSFDCADTTVSNIVMKNNSITAEVICEGKTFINCSQNYYPGWNVYVDGEKVENYQVNGLIQGAIVGEGRHIIEFSFESNTIRIGGVITLFTVLGLAFMTIYQKGSLKGRTNEKVCSK